MDQRQEFVESTVTPLQEAVYWTKPLERLGAHRCKDVAEKLNGQIWTSRLDRPQESDRTNLVSVHWAPNEEAVRVARTDRVSLWTHEDDGARVALRDFARLRRRFDEPTQRVWTGPGPMPPAEDAAKLDEEDARLGELMVVQKIKDHKLHYLVSFNGLYPEDEQRIDCPDRATAEKLLELIERHGDQRIAAEVHAELDEEEVGSPAWIKKEAAEIAQARDQRLEKDFERPECHVHYCERRGECGLTPHEIANCEAAIRAELHAAGMDKERPRPVPTPGVCDHTAVSNEWQNELRELMLHAARGIDEGLAKTWDLHVKLRAWVEEHLKEDKP